MSEITASPLCWPNGWRRTKTRTSAKFSKNESVKQSHPDGGGSHDAMTRINTARDTMLGAL